MERKRTRTTYSLAVFSYDEEKDDLFDGSLFQWRGRGKLIISRPYPTARTNTACLVDSPYGEGGNNLFDCGLLS